MPERIDKTQREIEVEKLLGEQAKKDAESQQIIEKAEKTLREAMVALNAQTPLSSEPIILPPEKPATKREGFIDRQYNPDNPDFVTPPPLETHTERITLTMEEAKQIFISKIGNSAKVIKLNLAPINEGVQLILELDAGWMGGKPSITGKIVNTNYRISLTDLKINANNLAYPKIEEKFSDFSNDTIKYFENKYRKSVLSIQIIGSNLVIEFSPEKTPPIETPKSTQFIKPLESIPAPKPVPPPPPEPKPIQPPIQPPRPEAPRIVLERDPLYVEALRLFDGVVRDEGISISKLKIYFNISPGRAARIIMTMQKDEMLDTVYDENGFLKLLKTQEQVEDFINSHKFVELRPETPREIPVREVRPIHPIRKPGFFDKRKNQLRTAILAGLGIIGGVGYVGKKIFYDEEDRRETNITEEKGRTTPTKQERKNIEPTQKSVPPPAVPVKKSEGKPSQFSKEQPPQTPAKEPSTTPQKESASTVQVAPITPEEIKAKIEKFKKRAEKETKEKEMIEKIREFGYPETVKNREWIKKYPEGITRKISKTPLGFVLTDYKDGEIINGPIDLNAGFVIGRER